MGCVERVVEPAGAFYLLLDVQVAGLVLGLLVHLVLSERCDELSVLLNVLRVAASALRGVTIDCSLGAIGALLTRAPGSHVESLA